MAAVSTITATIAKTSSTIMPIIIAFIIVSPLYFVPCHFVTLE